MTGLRDGLDGVLLDIDDTLVDTHASFRAGMAAVAVRLPAAPRRRRSARGRWRTGTRTSAGTTRSSSRVSWTSCSSAGCAPRRCSRTWAGRPLDDESFERWNATYDAAFRRPGRRCREPSSCCTRSRTPRVPFGAVTNHGGGVPDGQARAHRAVGAARPGRHGHPRRGQAGPGGVPARVRADRVRARPHRVRRERPRGGRRGSARRRAAGGLAGPRDRPPRGRHVEVAPAPAGGSDRARSTCSELFRPGSAWPPPIWGRAPPTASIGGRVTTGRWFSTSGRDTPLGYGVIGSTTDSGSVSLGSSPGTPARRFDRQAR